MAVGGHANLDQQRLNAQLAADAQYLQTAIYEWLARKYSAWNSISAQFGTVWTVAQDAAQVNAFVADLNRLKSVMEGNTLTVGQNMLYDIGQVTGPTAS